MSSSRSSFYDVQENYLKKMLDLQEKLRKSEEERIRLEERFNLLVQESRNRHQDCINRLRFRYAEFLEEQRARDLRNNKILEKLSKVDNSLVLMTAKTEKLNIVRKQYEAYLLRVYGNQRYNGSVTADSGLESQNEQEIPPSPIISKSVQPILKVSYPYLNQNFVSSTYKTADSTNDNLHKLNELLRSSELLSISNFKYSQTSSPLLTDDPSEVTKNRLLLSRHLENSFKCSNLFKSEIENDENSLKSSSSILPETNVPPDKELDRYLGKIKRMHINPNQNSEQDRKYEQSFDEADYEQNTSGDLLNITLSSDGLEPSAFEEANKDRGRIRMARQLFAARNTPIDYAEKMRELHNVPIPEVAVGENLVCGFKIPTVDKFRQPEIAQYQSSQQHFTKSLIQNSVDDAFAKIANYAESPQTVHQNQNFSPVDDSSQLNENEEKEQNLAENKPSHQEFKDDDDGCIEDDYDDTVDIDSWMPDDDAEEEQKNVRQKNNILNRPRRKLESIEEVEQDPEDEDVFEQNINDQKIRLDIGQSFISRDSDSNFFEPIGQTEDQALEIANYQNTKDNDNSQQYYKNNEDVHGEEQQKQEGNKKNIKYMEKNNEDIEEHPQHQYKSDDPNTKYEEYISEKNHHKNQPNKYLDEHQVDGFKREYKDYQSTKSDPKFNSEKIDEIEHDRNTEYNYLKESQVDDPESNLYSNEADEDSEFTDNAYIEQALADKSSTVNLKELKSSIESNKKNKKDIIKSILDSDSESFIERNLSNTESDFDFN